jgi:hypothetical protein
MEFDTNIDSLIKSYPSLQRLPDKNRVGRITIFEKMKFFRFLVD